MVVSMAISGGGVICAFVYVSVSVLSVKFAFMCLLCYPPSYVDFFFFFLIKGNCLVTKFTNSFSGRFKIPYILTPSYVHPNV